MSRLPRPVRFDAGEELSAGKLNTVSQSAAKAEQLARLLAADGITISLTPGGQTVRLAGGVPPVELGRILTGPDPATNRPWDQITYTARFDSVADPQTVPPNLRFHPALVATPAGSVSQLFRPAAPGTPILVYRVPCSEGECAGGAVYSVFFRVLFERPAARVCEE